MVTSINELQVTHSVAVVREIIELNATVDKAILNSTGGCR